MSVRLIAVVVALVAAATINQPRAQSPSRVTVGLVPNIPAATTYIGIAKGYFRDAGIEVAIETIDDANTALPFLATNRMQVVEGGVGIGYFNAVAQGLPIIMTLDQGSGPLYHTMMLRPDLKDEIKTIADLRGRVLSLPSSGSSQNYELGKLLGTAGLTLSDAEIKYVSFGQLGVAFANHAIDAAIAVPPITDLLLEKRIALPWFDTDAIIRPAPLEAVAFIVNSEWAAANRDLARRLFLALARASRDYCQAYHHGPNRGEVVDLLYKNAVLSDRARLDRMAWQARDPDGRFSIASLLDMQHWFFTTGKIDKELPAERLVDTSYADTAAQELGPFEVINQDSRLAGCR
jgi:NitT/TauT family transport system substrate-binding protein